MLESVLASSTGWFPSSHLSGYAFFGPDLIIGARGQSEFGNVETGHDGAYAAVVEDSANKVRLGTDGAGYGRLYLYQSDDGWAVGTSLIELAEYAHARRWQLSIDRLQLKAMWLKPRLISAQLLSRETGFREIRLLTQYEEVVVERGLTNGFEIVKRRKFEEEGYAIALQKALGELVGRMRTLINSGIPLVSDISGGRDSRTVLAALLAANNTNVSLGDQVRFRSNTNIAADWEIASSLSEKYGLKVNRSTATEHYPVDAKFGFDMWRKHDLGVYYPIYPYSNFSQELALSGAAGGVHRSVYAESDLDSNIRNLKSPRVTRREMERIAERVQMTMRAVAPTIEQNLEHFRLFRNRFHGGRNALRGLSIAPLASESLQCASNQLGRHHLERAQFYADVMMNLAPDLAEEPYDKPEKGWDDEHRRDFTPISNVGEAPTGNIYGSIRHDVPPRATEVEPPLEQFTDVFEDNARAVIDHKVLPRGYVYETGAGLYKSEQTGFAHAVDGIPVSAVLFAGEVIRLTNR